MHTRPIALALSLLVVNLAMGLAFAAPPKPIADKYLEGVRLEKDGDIVAALEKFESIAVDKRDHLTRLHIASCKRKLGRLLEAVVDLEAIKNDPKADAATVDTAASDLDDLRPRIPKLTIRISAVTTGAAVSVDGNVVAPPLTRSVNPGTHVVIAKRGDATVFERSVTLAESTSIEVEIDAPAASSITITSTPGNGSTASGGAASTKPKDAAPESSAGSSSRRTVGFITIGVGGVFALGAVGGYLLGNKAADDLQSFRAANCAVRCDDDDKVSAVKRWDTVTFVGAGLAVVAIGVGVTLVLTAPSESHPSVALKAGPGTFSIEGRF